MKVTFVREPIEEVWIAVEGFPNYEVSNFGRIVNIERGADLNPWADKNGYLKVKLYCKGVGCHFYVHRLVAEAFFLNYQDGLAVRHINEIKSDNTVLNLTLTDWVVKSRA